MATRKGRSPAGRRAGELFTGADKPPLVGPAAEPPASADFVRRRAACRRVRVKSGKRRAALPLPARAACGSVKERSPDSRTRSAPKRQLPGRRAFRACEAFHHLATGKCAPLSAAGQPGSHIIGMRAKEEPQE